MKNDTLTTHHPRRALVCGAAAAAVVLAAGCSSSATRTTARGWEFGPEGADAADVWASPTPRNTVVNANHHTATATPAGVHAHASPSAANAANTGGESLGSPFAPFAVTMGQSWEATSPPSQPQRRPQNARAQFDLGADAFGELPGATGWGVGSTASMMLDGMESLSQITFTGEGSSFDPCISRDGQFVVFASTQHRPTADIYIKPVHGRTVTQLTADPAHDIMPALSPDGKRVAFASNRSGTWNIYVMSVDGGHAVQLTSDPARELHPSWSPDGSRIVFCRLGEVSGRWEMWVMHLAENKAAEFIGYGLFPQWCPVPATGDHGRDRIAFQRSRERGDRAFSIWTLDYRPGDVSSPTEIASSTTEALINPNWSADGQWITYAAVPNTNLNTDHTGRPVAADLWIASLSGFGRVNLTSGNFVNLAPTWGPDGRIYFVSDRGGIENIWSVGTEKAIAAATGQLPGNSPARPTGHASNHPAPGTRSTDNGASTAYVPTP